MPRFRGSSQEQLVVLVGPPSAESLPEDDVDRPASDEVPPGSWLPAVPASEVPAVPVVPASEPF